ncbi:hypothetical protein [Stutzerimonas stutzeri]|uniref:hypothetical protein n=1 Tax=Stutzerimonas stutzeri TaxID=316 RepID=UPI0015E461AF|nr:hypothetical protein [Stutzerimonas stutzeri]MBA1227837.1 hypothetical protein [Stutzerimonas stutzeri]
MRLSIKVSGLELAQARLAEVGRQVDPALRGALNTTATKARTERYVKRMRGVFKTSRLGSRLGNADVRGKISIKRARRGRMNSRIIPSSSGVRVDDYSRWFFEWISPTRARVFVFGLRGRKLAAGFVNPASIGQRPLSTRGDKRVGAKQYRRNLKLQAAMGPSMAYWFKQLTDGQTIRWTNIVLQQEFERRIKREIAKGVR